MSSNTHPVKGPVDLAGSTTVSVERRSFRRRAGFGRHSAAAVVLAAITGLLVVRHGIAWAGGLGALALVAFLAERSLLSHDHEERRLKDANTVLRRDGERLEALVEFGSAIAGQTAEVGSLLTSARAALERIVGGRVELVAGSKLAPHLEPLHAGDVIVGGIHLDRGNAELWARIRGGILPELAAAISTATAIESSRQANLEAITALSRSIDAKHNYDGEHTERVATISVALGKRLGYVGADLDAIQIGALMRDVGKIGIPDTILHKPGPLNNDEWAVMKRHLVIAELMLAETGLSTIALEIVRSSNERMDGAGYPLGLVGEAIPLHARIVLVADAFDALTTDRPYRRARSTRAAIDEILANTGTQFCPEVGTALEQVAAEEPALLVGIARLSVVA